MFTSAELIEALRRRARRSLRPERAAGEFPEGWRLWFGSMRERLGAVTGASADAILAVLLAREPVPPPAAVAGLGRWQAMAALSRHDWEPAAADERSTRIAALSATLLLHLLFGLAIIWLLYTGVFIDAPAEPDRRRGEDVTQVEFIGEGTPDASGGGEATPQPEPAAPAASARPPAPPTPAAVPESRPQPPSATASLPDPEPAPQPQPAPHAPDLVVTETSTPDSHFVLPPLPSTPAAAAPTREVPEVAVRERALEVAAPTRRDLPRAPVAAPRDAPVIDTPDLQVRSREIPAPARVVAPVVAARTRSPAAPALRPRVVEAGARAIPMPAAAAQATAAGNTSAAAESRAPTGAAAGNRSATPAAGSGSSAARLPAGATATTRRGDDWGDSTRDAPGAERGRGGTSLFDGDGRPRLADGTGRVGGGLPPGTITEDYEKIDRMGTWLKRPPIGYEPTAFDRFWVPHESLLEEWVRRSIKEVLIPIPGTTKTVRCSVVALALGGACGISDANLQDVEAVARPPPEVPFKRELQEDQQSLGRPPGG